MPFSFQLVLLSSFLVCSISIFFSLHIIHSLVFLILVFIQASILLMINQLEFLSLILLIIYIGAIAVLFLFIVMLLNLKHVVVSWKLKASLVAFFFIALYYQHKNFFDFEEQNIPDEDSFFYTTNYLIDGLTNLEIFGQVLYNHYFVAVLLAGLVLLVAVIGPIVLTLNNRQKPYNHMKLEVKVPAVYPLIIKK